MCGSDICLGIIAIFFPPIAVWVKRGLCSADSLINLALCILGYIPGLIHSWYIICSTPEPTYEQLARDDPERGHHHVTYYIAQQNPSHPYQQPRQSDSAARGYGTVSQPPRPAAAAPPASHQQQQQAPAAGPSDGLPSYQQAVDGDHKVQKP